MNLNENEDTYIKKALEEKEKGNYDDAVYYLDWASLVAFSNGNLEKVMEIEKLLPELEGKTEYESSLFANFFIKVTSLMLKNEKLPNDVVDEFFRVVGCIEEIKEDIKYVVSALKIIIDYMESKNQEVPNWIYEWIKDKEEFINEMESIKKGSNVIIMSKNFKKGTVMGNFIGGMLNKSKMKIVEKLPNMEFGIIEVDGAVIEIPLKAMNFTGGIFIANGVRDEEHLKKIIKVIDNLIEKNIVWHDRGRC
ncbi:hypothetical protein [Methanotorris formicicus]|nr:hypothetical protein [Methanotorris formicicus]